MKSELLRIVRYAITGGVSTVIHVVVVILLVELAHFDPVIASIPAFCGAAAIGFILNRYWVFKSRGRMERQFFLFFATALAGLSINMGGMYVGTRVFTVPYTLTLVATVIIASITTYLLNKMLTFHSEKA